MSARTLRKHVGVLHALWAIVKNPSHHWEIQIVKGIVIVYVTMHDMIVEDKSSLGLENMFGEGGVIGVQSRLSFGELLEGTCELKNQCIHYASCSNLVQHL
jgi:hypothetical protein